MTQPGRAPLRVVVKVIEVRGPRGGTIHALVLECGCFITRRLKEMARAPDRVPCVACYVRSQMTLEPVVHQRASKPIGQPWTKRELAREDAGRIITTCGAEMLVDGGGWAWRPEHVTCPRCVAAMPPAPRKRPR